VSLVDHARRELELAGLFDSNSDYGGMLGNAIMKMVELFAEEGHSGASAAMTIAVLEKLLRFKPLTPLTNDPDEWMCVSEMMGHETWQSRRNSEAFSNDGGVTYYLLDDHEKKITAEPAKNLGQMARAVQQRP